MELMQRTFYATVPPNTVGLQTVPFSVAIYGPRSLASDSRLDFAFPARVAAAAEKKKLAAEALKPKVDKGENLGGAEVCSGAHWAYAGFERRGRRR